MPDVISRVLLFLEPPLTARGNDFDGVLSDHGLDPRTIRRLPGKRIAWNVFADVLEDAGDRLGGLRALEDLGASSLVWSWPALHALVSRYLTPRAAFHLGVQWFCPAIFRGIRGELAEVPEGLVETVFIPSDRRDSLEFFALCHGAMREYPAAIGWQTLDCEFTHSDRRGEYRMTFARVPERRREVGSIARGVSPEADLDELMCLGLELGETSSAFAPVQSERETTVERVRSLLRVEGGEIGDSATEIARRLGMSERSLVRRLGAEGTSFRAIRDEVRQQLAIERIRAGIPISEVAFQLGFAEPASFHRAFRRWTGRSPGGFKAGN